MELKPYNPKAVCPKCGNTGIGARYMPYQVLNPGGSVPESVTRTCAFCGYWWNELPLDSRGELPNAMP